MLDWREVFKDEREILLEAAGFGDDFPAFYRNAAGSWRKRDDALSALRFYRMRCDRLFGLFEGERLAGLVYLEKISDGVMNVHLDLRRGVSGPSLVRPIAGIRDEMFASGMRLCMAWALGRNRGVQRVLAAVGFKFSHLEMKVGSSHGKVLVWRQMLIAPGSYSQSEVMA